ncbi:fungal specific transcription factor domain-containing protein [Aspergillus neoniger CBS 115656]|uniref:Xylanolytic transcriptional activator regulatory domain-containing protein n=1 Tax=Aspergillus neoniger (strain CBS 115656) TaxID=1448310 RepID=A0A318YQQ7_ASPNB|nr:hypothetical protein BO87DRAFT_406147 [Aspergillus neoniger CBS 115656]PYH35083.1 hypothetical protein BO87DRAFT_406147 [Aspergillus neoniger CBS 115656]
MIHHTRGPPRNKHQRTAGFAPISSPLNLDPTPAFPIGIGFEMLQSLSCREFQACAFTSIAFKDREELQSSGTLLLPSEDLRGLLLQSYLRWVHPLVPVLEIPNIFQRLLESDDRQFPQPLLYQAVLYAGSSYVDSLELQAAGHPSRDTIGRVIRERARMLYNLSVERNPIVMTQTLILLSIRENLSEASLSESRYWIRHALSVAIGAGLLDPTDEPVNQNTEYLCTISSSLRERLVWSLYTADLTISLALDAPFQIKRPPSLNCQFVPDVFSVFDRAIINATFHFRATIPRQLCGILIERSKLIRCMYRLLYTVDLDRQTRDALDDGMKPAILLWKMQHLDQALVTSVESRLKRWLESLPASVRYSAQWTLIEHSRQSKEFTLCVHRGALYILYLTYLLALYNGKMARTPTYSESLVHRARQVAAEIVQTWAGLAETQAIDFLPSYCFLSLNLAREVYTQHSGGCNNSEDWYAMWAVRSCDASLAQGFHRTGDV